LFHSLETLGIDEIAIKKGQQSYLTIISVKIKEGSPSVIAVLSGRSRKSVETFLENIPKHLKKTVESICTDMYEGYINAAVEVFGTQKLVVDRYHVAKLYRKPLDTLRIKEMGRLKCELQSEEYAKLEGMVWILRRRHESLTHVDKEKLKLLYQFHLY